MAVAADPAGLVDLDRRVREAVEAVAATDPDPTDPFRGLYITDDVARSLARASPLDLLDDRVTDVAARLGIAGIDADVLLACAAPELSPRYGRLYAYLHDDVTRKLASPRLVARLLADEHRDRDAILGRFAHDAPLRRVGALRLLPSEQPGPLADRLVKVPDRVAAALLGAGLDERGGVRIVPVPEHPLGREQEIARLRGVGAADGGADAVALVVCGPDAAELLAAAAGRPVVLAAPATDGLPDAVLASALEGAVLAVGGDADADLLRALDAHDRRVVIVGRTRDVAVAAADRAPVVVEVQLPTYAERESAWRALAGTDEVRGVAAKFRLGMGQIAAAARAARARAAARDAAEPSPDELDACAREASLTRLGELATRIPAAFDWDDLVLPERQRELLRSISAHLRHRDLVLGEWGYDRKVARTQGLKVLFAGDSGTGKTLAAQVLAHALGLDLYRLDLATVVSKYIGETEKNLDRVFTAATGSNAILFFDEADAMLGKRSDVGDAHDRYANLEVAYLLQKMEQHDGCVVLATNLRQNIDEAFTRRLDAVVDFPFPEEEERERLWHLLLPDAAPLADDIDIPLLAREHRLSGGAIRNCSLTAAFLAAEDGSEITMAYLQRAVRIEYAKLGRLVG